MVNRVQTLRSSSQGVRPTGRSPGELYVNFPDNAFGVVNAAGTATDLVAVRFFSTGASYIAGDYVIQAGNLYRAVNPSAPGAFVAGNWSKVQSAADLATGYLPLVGGTLTGALLLSGDPSVALNPVTLQYLQAQLALYFPKTGGVLSGTVNIQPAAGGSILALNPLAAAQQAAVFFNQGGAQKWQLGKQIDDSFFIYDVVAAGYLLTSASGGTTVNFSRGIMLPADPTANLGAATKQYADSKVNKAGDTMSGQLGLSFAIPTIKLNKTASGQTAQVLGTLNGSNRWLMALGDATAESSGNAGSNFALYRYDDAGGYIDNPFFIGRNTGGAVFSQPVAVPTPVTAGQAATKGYVDGKLPPGTVVAFGSTTPPAGWLICNGQLVSTTTYAALYAAIGTAFGSGSGTFAVPDLRGRTVFGWDSGNASGRLTGAYAGGINAAGIGASYSGGEQGHTLTSPNEIPWHIHYPDTGVGTFMVNRTGLNNRATTGAASWDTGASTQPTGSGLAHNVVPPGLVLNYIISTGL